jgi:hypothetical protein
MKEENCSILSTSFADFPNLKLDFVMDFRGEKNVFLEAKLNPTDPMHDFSAIPGSEFIFLRAHTPGY